MLCASGEDLSLSHRKASGVALAPIKGSSALPHGIRGSGSVLREVEVAFANERLCNANNCTTFCRWNSTSIVYNLRTLKCANMRQNSKKVKCGFVCYIEVSYNDTDSFANWKYSS